MADLIGLKERSEGKWPSKGYVIFEGEDVLYKQQMLIMIFIIYLCCVYLFLFSTLNK